MAVEAVTKTIPFSVPLFVVEIALIVIKEFCDMVANQGSESSDEFF